jgi:hypothetical protein
MAEEEERIKEVTIIELEWKEDEKNAEGFSMVIWDAEEKEIFLEHYKEIVMSGMHWKCQ